VSTVKKVISDASQSESSENKTNSRNSSPVNNEVDLEELGIIEDVEEESSQVEEKKEVDLTLSVTNEADAEEGVQISAKSRLRARFASQFFAIKRKKRFLDFWSTKLH